MKILSPRVHGVLDYLLVAMFAVAPFLFAFDDQPLQEMICYAIAGTVLGLSLLTRYPLGLLKLIPFPLHGAVEFVTSFGLIALPWIGGFADDPLSRNFFVANGVLLFAVWVATDYRGVERVAPSTLDRDTRPGASAR